MDYATLSQILFNHLDWHPARIKTFSQATIALIVSGSVTLKHLAQSFQTQSKIDSTHRQLQRFLKEQIIDFHLFGIMIRELMGLAIAKALQFYYLGRAKSAVTAVTMLCGGAVSKRSIRNKIMRAWRYLDLCHLELNYQP